MHIGSSLNTVYSLYGKQKNNNIKASISAEKAFHTAETPKVYQIYSVGTEQKSMFLYWKRR
jgi:hypothetical protein